MSEFSKKSPVRLISWRHRVRSGWLTVLATATAVALAAPGHAQTVPPAPASPAPSADLAKVHLTAARNTLSDVTQLPAAAQLTGESRTRVQQLITNFNELIAKRSDWRGSYAKVEANLSTLLGSDATAPATGTPGAVGTSGAASVDPAIRAKLVEFRAHLDMFKTAASAPTAAPPPAAADAPPAAATPAPATAAPATTPPATPPATMPPAPTAPTASPTPESPTAPTASPTSEPPAAPPSSPGPPLPPSPDPNPDTPVSVSDGAQEVGGVARDLMLHVEALEVILGAQTRVQQEATAAAGGAVVSSETPSGSTRTTVTGPDVTLNGQQLEQIKTHLAEMRRLLEKK